MAKKDNIKIFLALAKSKGGSCLSKRYSNQKTKLKFRCSSGHTFIRSGHDIKSGKWCPECLKESNRLKKSEELVAQAQRIVKSKGGTLLSDHIFTKSEKVAWRCSEGHEWTQTLSEVMGGKNRSGTWCPFCAGKGRGIEFWRSLAKEKGGECLSKRFLGNNQKLKWRCKEGHEWSAKAGNVLHLNRWCPECGGSKPLDIEEMNRMAAERGGECLSKKYVNNETKLKWKCSEGHIFESSPKNIRALNRWCPKCPNSFGEEILRNFLNNLFNTKFIKSHPKWLKERGATKSLELDGFAKDLNIAFEHQGRFHFDYIPHFHKENRSLKDIQKRDRYKVKKCKELGVKLIVVPDVIRLLGVENLKSFLKAEFERLDITPVKDIDKTKLKVVGIKRSEYLDRLREICDKRDGKLISKEYSGSSTKLTFECSNGHQWKATPNKIFYGRWCPDCAILKNAEARTTVTIKELKDIAASRGGRCLSKTYHGYHKLHEWKCSSGHVWKAKFANIKQGQWCKICKRLEAGEKRRKNTLDEIKAYASENGGKCTSKTHQGPKSNHSFVCKKSHRFKLSYRQVKLGKWCPKCKTV